jgi:hypothetical protein
MQLPQPYLHTSERTFALVDRPQMLPREGIITDPVYGYHTIWAAEVPFIPAHVRKEERTFDTEATNRVTRNLQRQVRFLYDLAQSQEHLTTFELRLISQPRANGLARIGIAFLGKTFHSEERASRQAALQLWDKFSAVFPREDPFSYPLVPVQYLDRAVNAETRSFREWFEPLPMAQYTQPRSIVELRKYEDWPTVRDVGGVLHTRDYIPHCFVPALDYSAMARLFETLARQNQICLVAITLRPQRLSDQEVLILNELAGWYERAAQGEVQLNNPLADVYRRYFQDDIFASYLRERATLGKKVYESLVHEHRSLFLARLQVIGQPIAQDDLIEALGSEIMANAGNAYPSRWERAIAQADEWRWALFNFQWLEFARWGISPLIQQDRRILRLRQLATVSEATGAFRLPIAPGTGSIAGIIVRDEPFSLSAEDFAPVQQGIALGNLMDRGVPLAMPFIITTETLSDLTLLLGDTNLARVQALQQIGQGVQTMGMPWIHLTDSVEQATTLAEALKIPHIQLDAGTDNPQAEKLNINLLLPPPGVHLAKFQDALLRTLTTVFHLDQATSLVLRQALYEAYQTAGWTALERGKALSPKDLAQQIEQTAQQRSLPGEMANKLQISCALPLRDLEITAGTLFEEAEHLGWSLNGGAMISTGWLGSDTSNIFMRGCLWSWFSLALATIPVAHDYPRGLLSLEGAHLLVGQPTVSQRGNATMSQFIQQNISNKIGTLLIDDRPDLLDEAILQRALLTLVAHQSHPTALERTATFLGLSNRQRVRMAHLQNDEILITPRGSTTLLAAL